MIVKCNQCGYENTKTNNFCEECGKKLVCHEEEIFDENEAIQPSITKKKNQIEICIMEDGELVIQDLNSENEVYLNGEALETINLYALLDGDFIEIGDSGIQVRFLNQFVMKS